MVTLRTRYSAFWNEIGPLTGAVSAMKVPRGRERGQAQPDDERSFDGGAYRSRRRVRRRNL